MKLQQFCILLGALWISASHTTQLDAQDPVYSQFHGTPTLLNPAFTGNTLGPFIALQYRNQWPGLDAYKTYSLAYDQFFPTVNSGFGVSMMSDQEGGGIYKTNRFSGLYGYRVELDNQMFIKLGVTATFIQRTLDWNRLIFYDQLHPVTGPVDGSGNPNPSGELPPDDLTKSVFDFSSGLLVYNSTWYGGLALHHLTSPNIGFIATNNNLQAGLPLRWSIHGGYNFYLADHDDKTPMFISPNVLFEIRQGQSSQINGGMYIRLNKIVGGANYRFSGSNSDAVIAMVGFQQDLFRIAYSYDYTINGLTNGKTGGAHELNVTLNFDNSAYFNEKRRKSRFMDCLHLFR